MIKWELKEQFEQQDAKFHALRARYDQAVIEVDTRIADLKAEQAAILQTELVTGQAKSADKARVMQALEAAEKELATKEAERIEAHRFANDGAQVDRISLRDLLNDWNGPYRQTVREQELTPIVERMAAARSEYYNALLDWYDLKDKYHAKEYEIKDMRYTDNRNRPGDHRTAKDVTTRSDLPLITEEELYYLQIGNRTLPDGVKRIKGAK
jgi:hypothetical protein